MYQKKSRVFPGFFLKVPQAVAEIILLSQTTA